MYVYIKAFIFFDDSLYAKKTIVFGVVWCGFVMGSY